MNIDRLVKKDEHTGKNVPDTDKYFTIKEKQRFYAGYAFETLMVSQRFVDKMAALENVEQEFKFDLPMLQSALSKGILNADGQHLTGLRLALEINAETENEEWCLSVHDTDELFFLKDFGVTWTLWDKNDEERNY